VNALLSGCSFSAACGWGAPDYRTDPRCWYNILAKKYQLNINNIAYGGHSNREIIHRAKQQVLDNSYDLVIIQLTMTNRVWYWRESDPLSWVNSIGAETWNTKTDLERQSLRTMALAFNNHINEVERDLTDLIILQKYLKTTPLLLVNFSNFGQVVLNMINDCPDDSAELLPITIYKKQLASLASQLDLTYAVGFDTQLLKHTTDYADDNIHPGVVSNTVFADIVSKTMDKII
jgi:hypothetical protein